MIPIPYLKEALGVALIAALAFAGVQTVKLRILNAELDAAVAQTEVCYDNVNRCMSTVVGLRAELDAQSQAIRDAAEAGRKAAELQRELDRKAADLRNAERLIAAIQSENTDLRERAKELDTCSTCLLVLQSIAGVLP